MFILVYIGVAFAVSVGTAMLRMPAVYMLFVLAMAAPCCAITARRLHDINKSGWWQLISLVPFVGVIILIIWLASEGKNEGNLYGSVAHVSADVPVPVAPKAPAPETPPVSEPVVENKDDESVA